jgi:hypothetical protein
MEQPLNVIITAELILGNPSDGCQGHGICKVLTDSYAPKPKCPAVTTRVSLMANESLQFSFLKSSLSPSVIEQHFSTGLFKVEHVFEIPSGLKSRMDFKRDTIEPGLYPIRENDHFFMVLF